MAKSLSLSLLLMKRTLCSRDVILSPTFRSVDRFGFTSLMAVTVLLMRLKRSLQNSRKTILNEVQTKITCSKSILLNETAPLFISFLSYSCNSPNYRNIYFSGEAWFPTGVNRASVALIGKFKGMNYKLNQQNPPNFPISAAKALVAPFFHLVYLLKYLVL